jgi:predicted SprT family Zn-dependent metalloprotease
MSNALENLQVAMQKYRVITELFDNLKTTYSKELDGYKLDFNNRISALGLCSYRKKVIYISKVHLEATNLDQMIDTLKHEVAHAYSYYHNGKDGCGHNHHFYNACRVVGATPKRCASVSEDVFQVTPKYLGICKVHNVVARYHRFVSGKRSCQKCSNKYDERFLLDVVKFEDYKQGETK